MKKIDVIIIGAGPAGLFAGAQIKNKSVLLLDQNKTSSLKLLMSGAGQCNFTHTGDMKHFLEQYNNQKAFLKVAFKQFLNEDSQKYFISKGLEIFTREDGKVFPKSLSAEEVKSVLVADNKRLGHSIHCEESVKSIQESESGFQVITDKSSYLATYLIAAFGGCSYPTTGSDGQLYKCFKNLGHKIMPLKPALSPIYAEKEALLSLQGVSFKEISVQCVRENKQVGNYIGDLLITHFGLSGPVVLNNSRCFMPGDDLRLQFINMDRLAFNQFLIEKSASNGKQELGTLLKGLECPKRLIEFILDLIKIPKTLKLSELTKVQRKELVEHLCTYSVKIHHVGGYNIAMATTGGVDLQEVNRKTMMSKLIPNLFFAGECMDVDGATGGYNIQWAMTSGFIAGKSIDDLSQ